MTFGAIFICISVMTMLNAKGYLVIAGAECEICNAGSIRTYGVARNLDASRLPPGLKQKGDLS